MAKAKFDPYKAITDKFIEALKQDKIPWHKPWKCTGSNLPKSLSTGKVYNGINLLILGSSPFTCPVWGTFKQWQEKGGKIRKGEKSTTICFFKWMEYKDENGNPRLDKNGKTKKWPMLRTFNVFNAEQVEEINLEDFMPAEDEENEFTPLQEAEEIVSNMPMCPAIKHGGNKAFYSPIQDYIKTPKPEHFDNAADYYGTLFHEMVHSTGHASRVDRKLVSNFGSHDYSKEELIAEIGSCFLQAEAGIQVEKKIENHKAYIQSWISKLQNDPRMIVSASTAAKHAVKFIMNR
jgi:antirestriction protein ArdC